MNEDDFILERLSLFLSFFFFFWVGIIAGIIYETGTGFLNDKVVGRRAMTKMGNSRKLCGRPSSVLFLEKNKNKKIAYVQNCSFFF